MLRTHDIEFFHGDIRCPEDLETVPDFDLLIECSAEPSVHAGQDGSPFAVVNNNLVGAIHCLEAARSRNAAFLFLSTSRVYPIGPLNDLSWTEAETRFELDDVQTLAGCSHEGLSEAFPLEGARSFYGTTKLAAELLIDEYVFSYGMPALINRCGVIAGPGQMGKVDQGVITLWVARHLFEVPLSYIGFGGSGKQVRDILHVDDLFQLLDQQIADVSKWDGRRYNVGGGRASSVSLLELTGLCQRVTGKSVAISPVPETTAVDVRIYISDTSRVRSDFDWEPSRTPEDIVREVANWIGEHEEVLRQILAG